MANYYSLDMRSAMVAPNPPLAFDTAFAPEAGQAVEVEPGIVRVTAPNAGPYTFRGTNSFLIGDGPLFVLDPGPDDPRHLEALQRAIGGRGVAAIVITHTHRDHTGLARRLQAATGAPLWFGGRHRSSRPRRFLEFDPVAAGSDWQLLPDRVLADGDRIAAGGIGLEAIATPGHCANHLAFGVTGTPWLFTGDHIMGWNSTLVPVPDGSMADYLGSLEKVIGLAYAHYLPAHGGPIPDGPAYARALLAHREQRNTQVIEAVVAGVTSLGRLQRRIYPTLAPSLRGAARMTLKAHVEYLAEQGRIRASYGPFGPRLAPSTA
jgi:glyoxylase-like metal-dependent hydrolase (beta-lactamase superfamily II)